MNRDITIIGEINREKEEKIINKLLDIDKFYRIKINENSDYDPYPINIYISSCGGRYESALAIYNTIRSMCVKVNTFAISSIYSSALLIFLAGYNRYSYNNVLFMFHEGTMQYETRTINEYKGGYESVKNMIHNSINIISNNTCLSYDDVKEKIEGGKEWYFDVNEAYKIGMFTSDYRAPFNIQSIQCIKKNT